MRSATIIGDGNAKIIGVNVLPDKEDINDLAYIITNSINGGKNESRSLIEKLQKFDKDATVRLHSIDGEEVIFVTAYKNNNESIFLETASGNDMISEIDARLEDIKSHNEERSRYIDMWLDGIDVEKVRKYAGEEATERMEKIIKSYK